MYIQKPTFLLVGQGGKPFLKIRVVAGNRTTIGIKERQCLIEIIDIPM